MILVGLGALAARYRDHLAKNPPLLLHRAAAMLAGGGDPGEDNFRYHNAPKRTRNLDHGNWVETARHGRKDSSGRGGAYCASENGWLVWLAN